MTWRAARSLLVLHQQLQAGAPRARPPATAAYEWGLIGDAAHDPTSDHSPRNFPGWGSQIVTAADFPNRPDLGLDAHQVLDDIRRSHDARVKYGISNDRIFSNHAADGFPAWTWRPYLPNNPLRDQHRTHGHLSVVGDARADGTEPWATIGGDQMGAAELNASRNAFTILTMGKSVRVFPGDKDGAAEEEVPNALAATLKGLVADLAAVKAAVTGPAPVVLDQAAEERIAELLAQKLGALRFVADE